MYAKVQREELHEIIIVYTISAFDLHPSLLRILTPVRKSCFVDFNNELRQVRRVETIIESVDNSVDIEDNLYVLNKCIDAALQANMKFLKDIKLFVDDADRNKLRVLISGV